jgi:type IV pilus assembly protein PilA
MANQPPYAQPMQPPQKSGVPGWMIGCLIAGAALLLIGGVLTVLAVHGTRKYISNAKQAEARNSLGQIAKDATAAYERDHAICKSASSPVPKIVPSGVKYQSTPSEWAVDAASNGGFDCLKFALDMPQYYQYDYRATPATFEGIAHGDLDGDGVESTFKIQGQLTGGTLMTAPSILEISPDE